MSLTVMARAMELKKKHPEIVAALASEMTPQRAEHVTALIIVIAQDAIAEHRERNRRLRREPA